MLLFKFCLHWRKGRQKMDANRAYHLTLVMSVRAKHCLKYPSKFQDPNPLSDTQRKTWYIQRHCISTSSPQETLRQEQRASPESQETAEVGITWEYSLEQPAGDIFGWLSMPCSPCCIWLLCNQCVVLHLAVGIPHEEPDPGMPGSTSSLPDPISESGDCDSTALPVQLGLRNRASAPPLASASCGMA